MVAFDVAADRPEEIDLILNGLDRYNPDATTAFQEYVQFQCKNQTYDLFANLALLKLYQFNPLLMRDKVVTNVLAKALMSFPSPDFSLSLALLPCHILIPTAEAPETASPFSEAVQKLDRLNSLLSTAQYTAFWSAMSTDSIYKDLFADIDGFESLVRIRIALAVSQSVRNVSTSTLQSWFALSGDEFTNFVKEDCGWTITEDGNVEVPLNSDNETKSLVVRENVKFNQFGRVIRRALEQSA